MWGWGYESHGEGGDLFPADDVDDDDEEEGEEGDAVDDDEGDENV